jgi:hypothetical protein
MGGARSRSVVILLGLVLIATMVTLYLGRGDVRAVTRLGFAASAVGLLTLPLAFLSPNLLVFYLGAMVIAYGIAVLVGCLVMTRCGRNARV